jgi:hypothetical protein
MGYMRRGNRLFSMYWDKYKNPHYDGLASINSGVTGIYLHMKATD